MRFLVAAVAATIVGARPIPSYFSPRTSNVASAATGECTPPVFGTKEYFAVVDTWGRTSFDTGKVDSCNAIEGFQYCLLVSVNRNTSGLNFGICVPDSCTDADLFAYPMLGFIQLHATVSLIIGSSPGDYEVYCGSQALPWDTGTYATITLMVVAALVCVAATARLLLALPRAAAAAAGDSEAGPSVKGHAAVPLWAALLDAFDLGSSCRRMVAMKGERSGPLAALNGVRVLSMSLVVLGHTLLWPLTVPGFINTQAVLPPHGAMTTVPFQIIPSAEFAVDTFFLLSGFLATFSLVKALAPPQARRSCGGAEEGSLLPRWLRLEIAAPRRTLAKPLVPTLTYFVVHRLWRMWPAYGFSILVWTFVLPVVADGPWWTVAVEQGASICKSQWWTNMLFVNDLVPGTSLTGVPLSQQCMGWTWYLGCDVLYYLFLVPPLAVAYALKPAAGWAAAAAALVIFLATGAAEAHKQNYTGLTDFMGHFNGQSNWYQLPWTRAAPYIVGIMLAFAYLRWLSEQIPSPSSSSGLTGVLDADAQRSSPSALKGGKGHSELTESLLGRETAAAGTEKPAPAAASISASPRPSTFDAAVVTSIHVACIAGLSFLFWIPVTYYQTLNPGWSYPANLIYTAFSKTAWVALLGILLYLCFTGRGGAVHWLMSLPFWEPLARLTFGAYLLHPFLITILFGAATAPIYYSALWLATTFLPMFVAAYCFAGVLFVLVEQPSANLEHVLLGRLFAALGRRGSDGAPRSARTLKPSSVLKLGGDSGLAGPPVPADSATVSVAPVFDGRSINAGN